MLELLILKREKNRQILLLDDGELIEFYDETNVENRNEGNIFLGIVRNILPGMESAFVDIGTEKNSFIHLQDLLPKVDQTKESNKNVNVKTSINNVVKVRDRLLVQVEKDSNELKGARISTHINLPGKYIALMPNTDIITVSQKIEDEKEKQRLIKLVKENLSSNNGAIIRTAANGKTQEIIDDIRYLEKLWQKIDRDYKNTKTNKPKLIHKNQDILQKLLVDLLTKNIQKIICNDSKELEKIKKSLLNEKEFEKIQFEIKNLEELEKIYDFENQILKIEKRKIWLKCGGFITIDKTEALTAIDVNTGKFTDGKNLGDVVFKVNEQATKEIAKQIRLRDIGGIIIIDYIDMLRQGDKEKIEELLKKCLKEDRAKTQVEGFTKLDLMELTRKHICSHKS